MAIVQYPDNWPKLNLAKPYSPVSPFIATQLQGGLTRRRRMFTAVPVPFSGSIVFLNRDDAYAFTQWFKNDLQDGVLPFEIPLLTSAGYKKELVSFVDMYVETSITSTAVKFDVKLQITLRPVK